jgi:DNA-binding XRE family transcriptional regulator
MKATKELKQLAKTVQATKAFETAEHVEAKVAVKLPAGGSFTETMRKSVPTRGKVFTTLEAAQLVGVCRNTMKNWRRNDAAPQPTFAVTRGDVVVYFYTLADVRALKQWRKRSE